MTGTAGFPSALSLAALAASEMTALAELLAEARPGQSVHGARRRIKRLRSLLRLLRDGLGETAYRDANAALRAAADALAGHRRAEALLAAADKLGASDDSGWRGVATAYGQAHDTTADPEEALAAARTAIARAGTVLRTTQFTAADETVVAAFLSSYGRARRRLRRGLESGAADALHEARKFVIHHLHHIQFLQPGRQKRIAALEELREALGDLNDLAELRQLAAGHQISAADEKHMRRACDRLVRKVTKASGRLFRHAPDRVRKRLRHAASRVFPGGRMG